MALVVALDHVQITAPPSRAEATVAFYRDTLGMSEIAKPAPLARNGCAWFRIGANELHVSVEDIPEDHNAASRRHICYTVTDLAAARDALEARRVTIIDDRQPIPGWKRFYIRDPADNRIEIGERIAAPS
ncbi:MAG: VOC family protein [Azospirillaceae bacterium]